MLQIKTTRAEDKSMSNSYNEEEDVGPPALKTILYWNSFFAFKDFNFGFGQQPFLDAKCPTATCFLTNDRTLFNQSDVVIFSVQQMNLTDLPPYRFAHQRFVFYEMESPATTNPPTLLYNRTRYGFFNWTMTYRLDSDIVNRDAYGIVVPIANSTASSVYPKSRPASKAPTPHRRNYPPVNISGKKKLAAWFVSNCVTSGRREDYVKELIRYISVDIYGKCGNLTCADQTRSREMVRDDYKFYIGFENSLCTDYVTEKLMVGLLYDAVPVSRFEILI
jgi:alpha-1,3-fucosyltransferase